MCLLVAKPANVPFPKEWIEMCKNAASSNSDGLGFGTLGGRIHKSVIQKPEEFAARCIEEIPVGYPAIIHFRFSTGGRVNSQNCHPFMIADGTVFAHNGIISSEYPPTTDDCDTAVLGKSVQTHEELHDACTRLVKNGSNKFAYITPSGMLTIVGEKHGNWDQGFWWSNCGYRRSTYVVSGFRGRGGHFYESDVPLNLGDLVDLEDEVESMCRRVGAWNVEKIIDMCETHGAETVREMLKMVRVRN